ncbi:MAG TPA: sulfate adenylyltransferase [Blastocatellia bacterium]|nr:sulfate adenylyltransferase [Blastocatellia bacterium]
MSSILPHGGKLVNREIPSDQRSEYQIRALRLPKIVVNDRVIADLEMIAVGAMSPLDGFMTSADYRSVVDHVHLASGLPWSIPITLAVSDDEASRLKQDEEVALYDRTGRLLAILSIIEKFKYDKTDEARNVYRTTEEKHPGVSALFAQGDWLLGGPITLINRPQHSEFLSYRKDPSEVRRVFQERGWRTVVAFQTRNPIHRAHEYIQKSALEIVDGLLVHPLVGATKGDDVPAHLRMRCYEVLLEKYYPRDRTILSVFPAAMRYAGPREAVFHAIIRKNYGCTHFIVGRDHAGVGNYYGTYDAHHIFADIDKEKLGITPLFFDHAFFCHTCGAMASEKTCPHTADQRVILSGTKVREMLVRGEIPPVEFTRPEVAAVLREAYATAA